MNMLPWPYGPRCSSKIGCLFAIALYLVRNILFVSFEHGAALTRLCGTLKLISGCSFSREELAGSLAPLSDKIRPKQEL